MFPLIFSCKNIFYKNVRNFKNIFKNIKPEAEIFKRISFLCVENL